MTEFIKYEDVTPENRKTKIISIKSKNDIKLGEIRFWGAWRQYTFHPFEGTVFDIKCLQSIINEVNLLNDEIRSIWKDKRIRDDDKNNRKI